MAAKAPVKKNMSAIKRARQAEKRAQANRSAKSVLRTLAKKVDAEISGKNKEGAQLALEKIVSALDRAASKGIIHRNTAARKVSQLSRKVNSLSLPGAA